MFVSLTTLLSLVAMIDLVSAAPPAQSTYCYEDNLLRAFQHTPTPASGYCTTATGYPTFLAIKSYPPTRLSSACSCFSRFPTEGVAAPSTTTTSTTCTPTEYLYNGTPSQNSIQQLNLLLSIGPGQTCGDGIWAGSGSGHVVLGLCGAAFSYNSVGFDSLISTVGHPDYCFDPTSQAGLSAAGIDFEVGNSVYGLSATGTGTELTLKDSSGATTVYYGSFVPVPCASSPDCPAPTY